MGWSNFKGYEGVAIVEPTVQTQENSFSA